nr:MAG TPA: adenine-specific methyltransferase [Caudoviricetes sp.]
MKPFLKHSGGKAREIKNFLSHIPNNYNRYIEPFVGGGAVFWYLEPKSAIINDLNKNLIECYKSVKFDYNTISSELDELVKNYNVDLHHTKFYELRDMFNGIRDREYSQGTLYYYINKLVVSGLMRYNSKGYLNTPYSHNSSFFKKSFN